MGCMVVKRFLSKTKWREDKQNLGRPIAPEGLQDSAQGFNPGKHSIERYALKGRKICPDQSHTYRSSKRILVFV
jgi:hypothetical protein